MKTRLRYRKWAAVAAATILLGATPALAHDGPATRSAGALGHGALSSASFFNLTHFGGFGWGHGGGWDDGHGWNGNGWGRGHDNGNGWGRGHDHGHDRGHGHGHGGGDGWHGGGHPCSPG